MREDSPSRQNFIAAAEPSLSSHCCQTGGVVTDFYLHPQGICETTHVGKGTRIWAFAHVLPGARIGRDCNICDNVFIESDVTIGDNVTVKSGVQLWNGVRLGNHVFVGPNATFTNDKFPRSKQYLSHYPETVVEDGVSIGANATILPGVRIGFRAMIGAGTVVTQDVPARATVVGNPGRVVGYAGAADVDAVSCTLPDDYRPALIRLGTNEQARGRLFVADEGVVPFVPKRFFLVDKVPSGEARGNHAHHSSHQFFVAVSGHIFVAVDDGRRAFAIRLSRPDVGVYVPPRIWSMQFGHSADAVLFVLASDAYNRPGYISHYDEFCALVSQTEPR
jgi:UDP-2-acetamido-3-amino-2,3-dideoxy-glucuronate N-acetyltransferase